MALTLKMPEQQELRPRIIVFGVGGAGGNAVNNMIEKQLEGVDYVVANTDAQALQNSKSSRRIQLGLQATQGLGAGARPEVGASAAEENIDDIMDHLAGSHMCFITAGMGGGTGTGAAPVIARAAREMGILTVGVVTKPFQFEGARRMKFAETGIDELQQFVDTLIMIPNQNLFRLANERTTFADAFVLADDVLYQGVKGVTDLMVKPGLVNLDFADVRAVMDEMGKAMMGTGEASGETRAVEAAEKAIANPLLDEVSLKGAKGVLINITGGLDLTLFEVDEAANRIRQEVDPEANIIVGSTFDDTLEGIMRVSVVATGIDAKVVAEYTSPGQPSVGNTPRASMTHGASRTIQPRPTAAVAAPSSSVQQQPVVETQSKENNVASTNTDPATMKQPEVQHTVHEHTEHKTTAVHQATEQKNVTETNHSQSVFANQQNTSEEYSTANPPRIETRSPRFSGINSLINKMRATTSSSPRMTTQRKEAPVVSNSPGSAVVTPTSTQQAPTIQARAVGDDTSYNDEDMRIQIPSFLRRQAN